MIYASPIVVSTSYIRACELLIDILKMCANAPLSLIKLNCRNTPT